MADVDEKKCVSADKACKNILKAVIELQNVFSCDQAKFMHELEGLTTVRLLYSCGVPNGDYIEVIQDVSYGYMTVITDYEVLFSGNSCTVLSACEAVSHFLNLLEGDAIDYLSLVME